MVLLNIYLEFIYLNRRFLFARKLLLNPYYLREIYYSAFITLLEIPFNNLIILLPYQKFLLMI